MALSSKDKTSVRSEGNRIRRSTRGKISTQFRLRVYRGEDIAIGPGKVDLLQFVRESGSIQSAAARMKMSYMRAWNLIQMMNRCFREPLVETSRGGSNHGGARMTRYGERALKAYLRIEKAAEREVKRTRQTLLSMLK